MTKTWLITGASRGMGVQFAHAALAARHNVVATGRNPDTVRSALGEHEHLLVTAIDVTDPHRAEDAPPWRSPSRSSPPLNQRTERKQHASNCDV